MSANPQPTLQSLFDDLRLREHIHDPAFTHPFLQNMDMHEPARFLRMLAVNTCPEIPIVRHSIKEKFGGFSLAVVGAVRDWLCAEHGMGPEDAWHVPVAELARLLRGEDRGKGPAAGPEERPGNRMTVGEANRKAMQLLCKHRKKFVMISEREQAERIGCSWDTWRKTSLYGKLKKKKGESGARASKDAGPREVASLTHKVEAAGVLDVPNVLAQLIAESERDAASDPSPLEDDPPGTFPRRVNVHKRL
jgi:hypothetical protein